MNSGEPPVEEPDGGVAIDAITALGTALSRPDGRIATIADAAGQGSLLIVVVEPRGPRWDDVLTALRHSGARIVVVSQGRPEAARALVARTGLSERDVLVEPAPHPVSEALAATTVPTFVLVEGLELVAWQDGWDRELVTGLVARAGGRLEDAGHLPARTAASASRLTLDEQGRADREAEDAGAASHHGDAGPSGP
jgi:hypothetical protein